MHKVSEHNPPDSTHVKQSSFIHFVFLRPASPLPSSPFPLSVSLSFSLSLCLSISLSNRQFIHLSLNREGRWGTTDDFTPSFLQFSLFSDALWDLANSRTVHSLMLSSHLVFCLPCLLPPFTVPCKTVSGKIACWLQRRTRDRKVASSNPGRSRGRIFFSRVNFVC